MYLQQVRMIIDELALVGTILDQGTIIVAIFTNIDNDFLEVVGTLVARETSLSFATVSSTLIIHEIRMGQIEASNLALAVANYTSYNGNGGKNNKFGGGQNPNSNTGTTSKTGKQYWTHVPYARAPSMDPIAALTKLKLFPLSPSTMACSSVGLNVSHSCTMTSSFSATPPLVAPSAYLWIQIT